MITSSEAPYRLGIDIGGTFTDSVLVDQRDGKMWSTKVLTSEQPAEGALNAGLAVLAAANATFAEVATVVHGTTLAGNTVVQRRGTKVGFLTTAGFEDLLAIARETRYDSYDLAAPGIEPLVPRSSCRGAIERTLVDGTEYRPLDVARLRDLLVEWRRESPVQALAICFLHSYRNPLHEEQARSVVLDLWGSDFPISLSSEVSPEIREYERASTTVINAYLQPVMTGYLSTLAGQLAQQGYKGRLYVMLSSGGVTTTDVAERFPARMLESGPAAGALAAAHIATLAEMPSIVAMDVGGTTAKACLVERGQPAKSTWFEVARVARNQRGSGLILQLPSIDLIEIGAGGGSIAWRDALGSLRLGPQSAESRPGPASYGFGGRQATVTDASLLLGYLNAETFAGGKLRLHREEAESAVSAIAAEVSMSAEECALAIFELANEAMADAVRVHLAERGYAPESVAIVASGGGGPLHAAAVAQKLGVRRVLVPPRAGVLSALGLLVTPIAFELSRSGAQRLTTESDWEGVEHVVSNLERQGIELLRLAGGDNADLSLQRAADLRWVGQSHSVTVDLPPGPYDRSVLTEVIKAFDRICDRVYGAALEHTTLEVLTWRVTARGPAPMSGLRTHQEASVGSTVGERLTCYPQAGWIPASVFTRSCLSPGYSAEGPAIVEDWDSACLIGPGDRFTIDEQSNIDISIAGA
jgi:N-methylhydantoinase A/oxoprolinase/acetone carboxylase beta subunit